jgi:hypothetical protein
MRYDQHLTRWVFGVESPVDRSNPRELVLEVTVAKCAWVIRSGVKDGIENLSLLLQVESLQKACKTLVSHDVN